MGIEFFKVRSIRNTSLSGLNLFNIFNKFKKILKSENFSQKIHVYEVFSQNQTFLQLNTEVQPAKEHVLRKQKSFQTDLSSLL